MSNGRQPLPLPELASTPAADIHIVGLGPGALQDMTLAAWQVLISGAQVVLRTSRHPCAAELANTISVATCDDLYRQYGDSADAHAAIVRRVMALGKQPGGVVYAVPGHPWAGEATTRLILDAAPAVGLTVSVSGGISFVPPSFGSVAVDLMDGGQVVDALLLAREYHPTVDVCRPLLIGQLYARRLASDVKLTLANAYPDDHEVVVIHAAGTEDAALRRVALHELDQLDRFDPLTSLYVPPLEPGGSFTDLQEIVAHLRAPEGCPWDREQTLASLRQDLLSECVEVLEAIDLEAGGEDNREHIAEELGDVMMVATMMVQIATDEGRFRMADVMHHIVTKLIRRHPHIFGDTVVDGAGEVVANWDAIKAQEKAAKGQTETSPLDGVPAHLPALEKARELQSKASKAGLLDRAALARSAPELSALLGPEPDERAVGELLWALTALAREHGVNAEDALRAYAVLYRRRLEGEGTEA